MSDSVKYLINLGSGFRKETDYNLPRILDNNKWIVYSIDNMEIPNVSEISKENDNIITDITIHYWNINLADTDLTKQIDIKNSDVYILDGISCGFITNTSKQLVDTLIANNNTVYYMHYISSYNDSPSINSWKYYIDYIGVKIDDFCKPIDDLYLTSSKLNKHEFKQYDDFIEKIFNNIKLNNPSKKDRIIQAYRTNISTLAGSFSLQSPIDTFIGTAVLYPLDAENINLIRKTLTECEMMIIAKLFTKITPDNINKIEELVNINIIYFKPSCSAKNINLIGGLSHSYTLMYSILISLIVVVCMHIFNKKIKYMMQYPHFNSNHCYRAYV